MWRLWRKATSYHKLPSEIFGEENALAAWMLDNAVTTFGTLVENMLQEREEVSVGDRKEYRQRYSIAQLLDPTFVFPRDDDAEEDGGGWDESTWDESQLKPDGKAINLNGIVGIQGLNFDEIKG
jgi:hypothetical protein